MADLLEDFDLLVRSSSIDAGTYSDGDDWLNEGTAAADAVPATAESYSGPGTGFRTSPAFFGPEDGLPPLRYFTGRTNENDPTPSARSLLAASHTSAMDFTDGFFIAWQSRSIEDAFSHNAPQAVRVGKLTDDDSALVINCAQTDTGQLKVVWDGVGGTDTLGTAGVADVYEVGTFAVAIVKGVSNSTAYAYIQDEDAPDETIGGRGWRLLDSETIGGTPSPSTSTNDLQVGIGKGWYGWAEVYEWDGTTATAVALCHPDEDGTAWDGSGETFISSGTTWTLGAESLIVDASDQGFVNGVAQPGSGFTVTDATLDVGTGDFTAFAEVAIGVPSPATFIPIMGWLEGNFGGGGKGWVLARSSFFSPGGVGAVAGDGSWFDLVSSTWATGRHLLALRRAGNDLDLFLDGSNVGTVDVTGRDLAAAATLNFLIDTLAGFDFGLKVGLALTDYEISVRLPNALAGIPDPTFPTLSIETSLTTDPLDTPDWEDQSAYVKALSYSRGRDQALEGQFQPATARVYFDNPDRRFDPEHAAGPHYGDLVPGKRVRARASWQGTDFDLYGGFVEGWPQTYRGIESADCVVPASDGLTMLNRAELADAPFESIIASLSPVHWWKLGEPAGSVVVNDAALGRRDGSAHGEAQEGLGGDGLDPASAASALVLTGGGYIDVSGCDEDWTSLSFLMRSDGGGRIWSSESVELFTTGGRLRMADATDNVDTSPSVVVDGEVATVVIIRPSPGVFTVYHNGVLYPTSTTAGPGPSGSTLRAVIGSNRSPDDAVGWVGALQHVALYDYALSADEAARLYDASLGQFDGDTSGERITRLLDLAAWPAADRDIDTGTVTLGGVTENQWASTILDTARLVDASEAGALYQQPDYVMRFRERTDHLTATRSTTSQYTFSDDPNEDLHYEDLGFPEQSTYLYNRVKVTWAGGEVTVADDASVTAYGPREHSITTILPTAAQARSLGEWIIDHYSQPVTRIDSLVLNPGADIRLWTACLDLREGDRITVRRHPQGIGAAIELDLIVEGIDAQITNGLSAIYTLSVSAADTQEYWIWGTSEWNETTRWA